MYFQHESTYRKAELEKKRERKEKKRGVEGRDREERRGRAMMV
jgi:hypothetical protein